MPADRAIRIDDPGDPRIAGFRDIRERDLRRSSGRFIVEGTVVLRVLAGVHGARNGFAAESILVLESRLAGIADILGAFPDDVPVHVAGRDVIDAIAGFPMHRGVLALARRNDSVSGLDHVLGGLRDDALVVVGQAISNHDNMGAIFRNAAALGADAVLVDRQSCDPLYRKAIRVSVGGVLRTPFAREGAIDDILAHLTAAGFDLWGLSPGGRTAVADIPLSARMALVLGTEGDGLPPALLARLKTARIPQAPGMDSLNVATALAVALATMAGRMGRLA